MSSAIEILNQTVAACTLCPLNDHHHLPVPGVGVLNPDLFVVAEAPGREEADPVFHPGQRYGVPLVGPAGHAFQEFLAELGFSDLSFHVTNTVLHRPPKNRPPTEIEKTICSAYLIARILLVKPKTILALGKHAGEVLWKLTGTKPLDEPYRGKEFVLSLTNPHTKEIIQSRIFCTHHPSYALLRNPSKKPELEQDLKKVLSWVREEKWITIN